MKKDSWPKQGVEQVKRHLIEPLVAFVRHPFAPGDPAERDRRDPSRVIAGYWAPPGRVESYVSIEHWLQTGGSNPNPPRSSEPPRGGNLE